MKTRNTLLLRCLLLFGIMIGAALWAANLMDSLYAYRSPLHAQPPAPGVPLSEIGPPLARRVVIILIDALREDTSRNPSVMPHLNQLRQEGASATMHSRPPSYSAPSYTVIFTGAWPDLSDGPALNLEYESIPAWTQDNLFSAAQRSGLKTAVSAYYWFEKLIPPAAVSSSFYTEGEDQQADRLVVEAALPWLQDDTYSLILVHLDQVDYAGHYEGGPLAAGWAQAARRADGLLEEMSGQLDFSKDTLLVISDHGQIDRGGHGGNESVVLTEPMVLAGAGVKPGTFGDINMVDIAPTVAALLGLNIPASSQGRILSEMLTLKPNVSLQMQEAAAAQQRQLLLAYQSAIDNLKIVEPEPATVEAYQQGLEKARLRRLRSERILRLLPALLALTSPAVWLWLRRRKEIGWFLFAGLTFHLIFNLRYALLDGRTYSLSSATSAEDLIGFCMSTAGLALLAVWGAAFYGSRAAALPTLSASLWTADLVLAVNYLVSLPLILSYFVNGPAVTWTLPDFGTMFLGFLSLLQILVVSALGLLLVSLISLAGFFRDRMLKAQSRGLSGSSRSAGG